MRLIPCESCTAHGGSCIAELSADNLDEFRTCAVTAIYRQRQVIFHEGMPALGLYILCRGAVKLYQSDNLGRDYIVEIAGPNDVLGELPLDPMDSYSVSAEALTDSQLCYLPRERLVEFVQKHPMTSVRLLGALGKSLRAARRKMCGFAPKGAESRLADLLVQLASAVGEPTGARAVTLGYSRREIAEMIGVSTETAIRLLGRLKQKDVIATDRRQVVIADMEKLTRIAARDARGEASL